MSSSQRRRVCLLNLDGFDLDADFEEELVKLKKVQDLVRDTFCHNTYFPIIASYFRVRELCSSVIQVSRYHRDYVYGEESLAFCKQIATYDFGTLVSCKDMKGSFTLKMMTTAYGFISA